jgi:hypothetical protein
MRPTMIAVACLLTALALVPAVTAISTPAPSATAPEAGKFYCIPPSGPPSVNRTLHAVVRTTCDTAQAIIDEVAGLAGVIYDEAMNVYDAVYRAYCRITGTC